jgi:signal transduction histidine kinase/CheY-like chemotaxis protein
VVAASTAPEPGAIHGNPVLDALAHERFVASFLEQTLRSQVRLLGSSAVVAYLWVRSGGGAGAVAWLLAVLVLVAWRHFKTHSFVRRPIAAQSTRRIAWLLGATGLLLSVPVVGFGAMDVFARSTLTMILLVVATVSVVTTSGFRNVFMAFALPQVLAAALAWAWLAWLQADMAYLLLAMLIGLYLSFLHGLAKHASAVFMDSCAYRLGEQQRNQELQQALAAAFEANQAKTQFLAAASHDLRQPIHSMNVLVAALSLRPLDASSKEIVTLLGSVNQLLSKQLDTLLDISKLDAGIVRAEPAPCRLDLIVQAHHGALAAVAAQQGVRLELDADTPLWVHTDAALLGRALSNLSDNALKYTPTGGSVRLGLLRRGDQAVLSVADTGIGIAAQEQARVFREFYQVANAERDRSKGLGLGLSIVSRLCALLKVQLALQSQPGQGTTVTLTLPLCAPGVADADPALGAAAQHTLTVLVVDDEVMVRESMRLLLQALGCTVHLAEGLAQAEAAALSQPLDLVLSDMRLRSGESGLAAVAAVRKHQPKVHAVLVTGDTAPDRIREARAAGLPLLFKPTTLNDLLAVLPRGGDSTLGSDGAIGADSRTQTPEA